MKYYTTSKLSENIHETPEGYLLCIGVPIARTGKMDYAKGETPLNTGDNGTVAIYRDEDEVFSPETIASFEGKSVTITHPEEFVNPINWSSLTKGVLQNVRRGEGEHKDDLLSDLLITDSIAIALVKNGLREVSCGYEADYTQTGEGKGKQTKIIGNHLALVEQGRAGSSYAIKDHKGATMKLKEKVAAVYETYFAKAKDEAMKIADESEVKPEEKKPEEKSKDSAAYDELVKVCKDLGEKVAALSKGKDADEPPAPKAEEKKPEEKAKDDDVVEKSIEERLKALEMLMEKMASAEAGDEEESEDADEEEMEDNDFEESSMAGDTADTASRAEILAPGIKITKDVKSKALVAAYGTKDGKAAIDAFTGGKAPNLKSAIVVDHLFAGASELLKSSRTSDLAKTKNGAAVRDSSPTSGVMTPEMMNKKNEEYYKQK